MINAANFPRSPRLSLPLAAFFCLPALVSCATPAPSGDGPAIVSVTKAASEPAEGGKSRLGDFADGAIPGAGDVDWGPVREALWLPEATRVSEGGEALPDGHGWLYLDVPSDYATAAEALARHQRELTPAVSVMRVNDPEGTVLGVVKDDVSFTVSVTPDPANSRQFSVVMVRWEPAQTAD